MTRVHSSHTDEQILDLDAIGGDVMQACPHCGGEIVVRATGPDAKPQATCQGCGRMAIIDRPEDLDISGLATSKDCPHCGATVTITAFGAGQGTEVRCPECKRWKIIRPGDVPGYMVFLIPEVNMGYLEQRIDKLNRRAEKLGLDTFVTLTILDTKTTMEKRPPRKERIPVTRHTVEVTGVQVVLEGGWRFVGTIEHTDLEIGNILRAAPGEEIPRTYQHADPICEHCQTRRNRIDTYVITNEAGEFLQVGKTCLKDYMGHVSPHRLAAFAEFVAEFCEAVDEYEDLDFGGRYYPDIVNLKSLLTFTAGAIRLWGWTAKSDPDPYSTPTVYTANSWRQDAQGANSVWKIRGETVVTKDGRIAEILPEDEAKAEAVIAWVPTIPEEKLVKSDYLYNLAVVFAFAEDTDGFIKNRHDGLAASALAAYGREMEYQRRKEAERAALANGKEPGYIGEPKQRLTFTGLTLTAVIECESYQWGTSYLHKFIDGDGNHLTWFKSSWPALEEGKVYGGKATVKKHEDYQGTPQTVITRAKFEAESE